MITSVQQPLIRTGSMSSAREMWAWKRAKAIDAAGIRRVQIPPKPKPDWQPTEMLLGGESRNYQVRNIGKCPVCGVNEAVLETIYTSPVGKPTYLVRCSRLCGHTTPRMNQSRLAIRHWKLVAALSK